MRKAVFEIGSVGLFFDQSVLTDVLNFLLLPLYFLRSGHVRKVRGGCVCTSMAGSWIYLGLLLNARCISPFNKTIPFSGTAQRHIASRGSWSLGAL